MANPGEKKKPRAACPLGFVVTLRTAPIIPLSRLLTAGRNRRRGAIAAHCAKIIVTFELLADIAATPVQRVGVPCLVIVVLGRIVEHPDRVHAARQRFSHVADIVKAPTALPIGAIEAMRLPSPVDESLIANAAAV